jgi:hypothetical protein
MNKTTRKNMNIKTNLLCTITTAFAALAFATAAYGGYTPVGADGITASPRLRQMINERPSSVGTTKAAAAAPAMICPKCADVRTAKVSPQAKGSEIIMGVKQVSYRHACVGCDTKFNVVGAGKAKHLVATHNCTAKIANNLDCCASN